MFFTAPAPPPPPPPPPSIAKPPPPQAVQQAKIYPGGVPPPPQLPPPPPPVAKKEEKKSRNTDIPVELLADIQKVSLNRNAVKHDRSDAYCQAQAMMGKQKRKIVLKNLK